MSNKLPDTRLSNPVFADTWRTIASLLSGDKHLLDKPNPPAAYAEGNIGGNLFISNAKYKVTYCLVDPTTGDLISESEPSEISNIISVNAGKVTITLPKRSQKIANAFRVYRYTASSSILLSPTVTYAVNSSSDDATNSTFFVPGGTFTIDKNDPTHGAINHNDLGYSRSGSSTSSINVGTFSAASSNHGAGYAFNTIVFPTTSLPSLLAITDVTLQATVSPQLGSTGVGFSIRLYANNPTEDSVAAYLAIPAGGTNDSTFFNKCIQATGSRKYATATGAFSGGTPGTLRSLSLGGASSQIANDLASVKATGGNLNISVVPEYYNSGNDEYVILISPKLIVTSGTSPINYSTTSNSLQMGYGNDGTKKCSTGLRFQNVAVPQNATILSAYIKFTAFTDFVNQSTGTKLRIFGEASDNASTFGNETDYNGRTLTTASVDWDSTTTPALTTWTQNSVYQSPDISPIIQEIVNRGGWPAQGGNSIAIRVKDNGSSANSLRSAYSFNSSAAKAPVLVISYKSTSAVSTYKLVDTVIGDGVKVYVDNIPDSALASNASLPASASTDTVLSNLQTFIDPVNPFSDEQARISVSSKGGYKVPDDRILFITHMSNQDTAPVTLGSKTPTTFKLWRSDAPQGSTILTNPIPVPPGTTLSILNGSGNIDLFGYLSPTTDSSNIEVFWRTVSNTVSYTVTEKSFLMGGFSENESTTSQIQISRVEGGTFSAFYTENNGRYLDPNSNFSGGSYAVSDPSVPIMLKVGDVVKASAAGTYYIWGIKIKNI